MVLSARDREANAGRASLAGAEAYLQKPVDTQVLLVRRALGES